MRHRQLSAVLLGLSLALLAGCGGSSSSGPTGSGGGGGSSTATIQGQVIRGQSASGEPVVIVVLQRALGVAVAEAADPLTVELRDATTNALLKTTKTDPNGNFTFFNVDPGLYKVTVQGFAVASPPEVTVGAGDTGIITGTVTANNATLTATVVASNFDNPLQNDAQLGHAINIAQAGNCELTEVLARRESGMGWGRIARDCGASPGVVGLGRGNLSDAELADARARVNGKGGKGGGKGGGKKS